MEEVVTIGLDIAKHVFHAHGADGRGRVVFSRKLSRAKLLAFFGRQPRCMVALEACAGAHHWGRELARLGHDVRLIPPAYVLCSRSRSPFGRVRECPRSTRSFD